MTTTNIALAERRLAGTSTAFINALKDCTPEELPTAEAIADILADVRRRMANLALRMRNRMEAEG
jgi:hypothetical protein